MLMFAIRATLANWSQNDAEFQSIRNRRPTCSPPDSLEGAAIFNALDMDDMRGELLESLHALPADHVFSPTLLDAVKRGLNQAPDESILKPEPKP